MPLTIRLLLLLCCLAAPLRAQQVAVAPEPDWVEPATVPALPADLYRYTRDGQAFRLVDRQIRYLGGRRQTYMRIAVEAVNRSGLETVATLSRDFDPQIETMALVRLDLIRDGSRIAMADRVRPDIFRREARLEAGIIDGTLTAHYDIPGVRVGDVIDAAFLWDSADYLPGLGGEVDVDLGYDVPVALTRVVLHWPGGLPQPFVRASDPALLVAIAGEPGGTRYEWRLGAGKPRSRDPGAPPEDRPWAWLSVTPKPDWQAVQAPLVDYYSQPRPVPDNWRPAVEAIRSSGASATGRAYAALRKVQDDIRYVGLEVGAGGYLARPPETVVANGFGDCKDKALLLRTLLVALGIEARVALASTDDGFGLADSLPRMGAFDHMIVAARLRDRWVFMDPTESFQGGVGPTATEPDLGYVLPVAADSPGLVAIKAGARPLRETTIIEDFDFDADGARLDVRSTYRGNRAQEERRTWAESSLNDLARGYLAYYSGLYPGIEAAGDPEFHDNRIADLVVVTETYRIPAAALRDPDLWHDFPFAALGAFGNFDGIAATGRRDPLLMPHRTRYEHLVRIHNPPVRLAAPKPAAIDGKAFSYDFDASDIRDGLMLSWNYVSRRRAVAPQDLPQVLADVDRARKARMVSWNLDPADDPQPAGDGDSGWLPGWLRRGFTASLAGP